MRRNFRNIFVLFSLISLIGSPLVIAQTKNNERVPFEFECAYQLVSIGEFEKGIQKYRQVQLTNPGTALAMRCQQQIARAFLHSGKTAEALNEYDSIAANYPGTSAALGAKADSIYIRHFHKNSDLWLKKTDDLIVETGGISYKDVLKGNVPFDSRSRIPNNVRQEVAHMYGIIGSHLSDDRFLSPDKLRYDATLIIYKFVREEFPDYVGEIDQQMFYTICDREGIKDRRHFPRDKFPPKIRPIAPHEDLEIGETRPKIEVELEDGDFSQQQVNILRTNFVLDGKSIKDEMKVKSQLNTCGKLGPTFEKLRLSYRPPTPLSVGWHTVYVKAYDNGNLVSEKTWRFYVKK